MLQLPLYADRHYTPSGRLRIHAPPEPKAEQPGERRQRLSVSDHVKILTDRVTHLRGMIQTRSFETFNYGLLLGQVLIELKSTVRHGNYKFRRFGETGGWGRYCTQTLSLSPRTVRHYIQISNGFDSLPPHEKAASIADFPMKGWAGVLRRIRENSDPDEDEDDDDTPKRKRRKKYIPTGLQGQALRHCYALFDEFAEKVSPEIGKLADDEREQFFEYMQDYILRWDEEDDA